MDTSAIYHINEHVYAYPVGKDRLCVRLRTKRNDLDKVIVHYKNIYAHQEIARQLPMERILFDAHHDYYEATLQVAEKRFKYYFELHRGRERKFYTADGFLEEIRHFNAFFYPYINTDDLLDVPTWLQGEIVYQVFVDRFYRGKHAITSDSGQDWHIRPDRNTMYGGDLYGVIKKLDHLQRIGVKAIYLNPIFSSPSYHKYDIDDYETIEDAFGGEEALKALVASAHERGMKVILDGVFNHCSNKHPWFQDVVTRGSHSPYADWFIIDAFPINEREPNYDSFGGVVPSMPKFNSTHPEVIEALTDIAARLTKRFNIDGWRLDVADEVSHTFWKVFRKKIKAVRTDIVIIGEIWNHASRWLQGDEMDSVTNYKFREWAMRFAKAEIGASTFWEKTQANLALYKRPLYPYLINLIGSHDTARSRTVLGDDTAHMLLMAMMLTFEGVPLIYYGDEVGMDGEEDPDNRRAMRWDLVDTQLAHDIARLATYRSQSEALKHGHTTPILLDEEVIAFERSIDNTSVQVIINFSTRNIVHDAKKVVDVHVSDGAETSGSTVTIPAKSYAVVG